MIKERLSLLLACVALGGCVMMPPAPYGRVLQSGQNESSGGINFSYRPDKIHSYYESQGSEKITSDREIVNTTLLPLFFFVGASHGLSSFGTEWGWQFTPLSLEPALYLRQALYRPLDPGTASWALQLDGLYGLPNYSSFSIALAGTKRFGKKMEGTVALRGGTTSYPLWVWTSAGSGNYFSGPTKYDEVKIDYADLSFTFGSLEKKSRSSFEAILRLPLTAGKLLFDETSTRSYAPFTTSRSWAQVDFSPAIFVAFHSHLSGFTSYVAQALALPRRWTPRASPRSLDGEARLAFAAELASAGLPGDAADEYQQALRDFPQLDQAHAPLAELYLKLQEWELADYHAQRAVQADATSQTAIDLLRRAKLALKNNF